MGFRHKRTMTIVHNTRFPASSAPTKFIVWMAEAFAQKGVSVNLVIPRRYQSDPSLQGVTPEEYFGFDTLPFSVHKLLYIDERYVFPRRGGFIVQAVSFSLSLFFYVFLSSTAVYYTHDILTLPVFRAAKRLGKKFLLVYEHHYTPVDKVKRFGEKHGFSAVDIFVAQTQKLNDGLKNNRFLKQSQYISLTLPMGYRVKDFRVVANFARRTLKRRFNLPNTPVIGYAGSFLSVDGEKGVRTVIRALSHLKKDGLVVALCLLGGEKTMKNEYMKLADTLDVGSQLIFIDPVPPAEVAGYLRGFDICVLPFPDKPHYRSGMSPMKMFEYMASGTPIVSSDLPSVREVLDEGSCVFVRPGNPSSLASGIRKLLGYPGLAKKLASQAKKSSRRYSWNNRAKLLLDTIDALQQRTHVD